MLSAKDEYKSAASNISGNVSEARDNLRDAANKAGRSVRHIVDNASDNISDATEKVNSHIHNRPVQSSLMALGVGVVLGMLLRRR